MSDIQHLVFGSGYLVLGLVLLGTFVKVYLAYRRQWAEVPPLARRRGQVARAAAGGLAAAVTMIALGGLIMGGASLAVLGWAGVVVAALCYALLYPLADERRFI